MTSRDHKNITPDFDISLLEANLELSIEDRIRTHDEALEVALEFKRAGEQFYRDQKIAVTETSLNHVDR